MNWWFILLIIAMLFSGCASVGYENEPAKIAAPDMVLLNTHFDEDGSYQGMTLGGRWILN